MLYLVFAHTGEAPLRLGPMPSFKVQGALIIDHKGEIVARHNGHRWQLGERSFYRVDCEGPLRVKLDAASLTTRGPFDHLSLVNGTAYASRDVFAHYHSQSDSWTLQDGEHRIVSFVVTSVETQI